ncbi:MAG: hypothetical protein MUE44_14500 [Oscillatoriaceae cyanobacterium Prado104]|jgi:hypothetical protein|nr:hypothetical protein [Oscillatoriaceae cyanobacterium Prado104]
MKSLSILDEVVRTLEEDVNIARIKRIIFFACKEYWENDAEQLANVDLGNSIEELCRKYSRLEDIENVLNSIVSKVNKKVEYTLVADQIICQLSRLYEYQDFTKLETNISNFGGQESPAFQDEFQAEMPVVPEITRDPGNLFDVRQKILQQTNPLRAKILIFSLLYHEFTFSDRDWLLLKTQELDSLLRQLFNVCLTLAELETQLYRTAGNLDNKDESDRAASAIIQAMAPCYAKPQLEPGDRVSVPVKEDYDQTHLSNNVYEDRVTDIPKDYFEAGDITRMTQAAPIQYHYDPRENNLVADAFAVSLPNERAIGNSNSSTLDFKHELAETLLVVEMPPATASYEPEVPPIHLNISNSIEQKLSLEEEIKELVNQSANSASEQIKKILTDLEANLNEQFSTESEEQRLYWKYKALRNYVGKIQGFTGKLTKILGELESKESGRSTTKQQANVSGNAAQTQQRNERDRSRQQKLVEMAKQGNPKAISLLIDRVLYPKGISATAGFKDGWLHVILESDRPPNQQDTATYIYKKLCTLKAQFVNKVKIHGRQSGHKTLAWTQEFVKQNN